VVKLSALVDRVADASPEGHELFLHVVTPENYWPLPWYLRRFREERVGYWQDVATWADQSPPLPKPGVILCTEEIASEVEDTIPPGYTRRMTFGLRPGVRVLGYMRDDLWNAFQEKAGAQPL
jgi:predicted membrane-bound mannosyltransferase